LFLNDPFPDFSQTAGWTGGALGLSTFVGGGLPLLGFLAILYSVHLTIVLGVGGWLARRSRRAASLYIHID